MKKILLSVAFLGTTFIGAEAQQTIIFDSDNFSGEWLIVDSDGDGNNWHLVDGGTAEDPDLWLRSLSYENSTPGVPGSGGPLTPDNWIFSPEIDLTNVTDENITLSWKVAGQDPNFSVEKYTAYVSAGEGVDGFLASSINFSEIVTDNGPGGMDNFYQKTLDISSLAGQVVRVAFRHHDSTDQFAILIDDVVITSNSASIGDHLATSFSIYPNPATDVINISNSLDVIENVKITDLNGRVVKEIASDIEKVQINISDLAQGVYILNATSNGKTITEKIVKK